VTQYDVEVFQRVEKLIGVKMEKFNHEEAEVCGCTHTLSKQRDVFALMLSPSFV
jgi:hypothetical protein